MESLADWYRRYLDGCNEHRFDTLGEFVAEQVVVNDAPQGLPAYVAGLEAVVSVWVAADNLSVLDRRA
jgi:predicted ester cyclase